MRAWYALLALCMSVLAAAVLTLMAGGRPHALQTRGTASVHPEPAPGEPAAPRPVIPDLSPVIASPVTPTGSPESSRATGTAPATTAPAPASPSAITTTATATGTATATVLPSPSPSSSPPGREPSPSPDPEPSSPSPEGSPP